MHSIEMACLIICLLATINAPISWKRAQFGPRITWCGWTFDLSADTVQLAQTIVAKLLQQLAELRRGPKVPRKTLEACLGLLMWATFLSPHLRPFLAPLYSDLRSGKGTLHSIGANQWESFYEALDAQARVSASACLWLPKGGKFSKVIAVSNLPIQSKADVPRIPKTSQRTWVRIADPNRHEVHLRRESRDTLLWLESTFKHSTPHPLLMPALLQCMGAADAMAKSDVVGIGGCVCTSRGFAWFSETFCVQDVQQTWPQLTESAQQYIACFEMLAHLGLLQMSWLLMRARQTGRTCITPSWL